MTMLLAAHENWSSAKQQLVQALSNMAAPRLHLLLDVRAQGKTAWVQGSSAWRSKMLCVLPPHHVCACHLP